MDRRSPGKEIERSGVATAGALAFDDADPSRRQRLDRSARKRPAARA